MKKTTHKNIKFKLLIARKKETEEKILMVERKKCIHLQEMLAKFLPATMENRNQRDFL